MLLLPVIYNSDSRNNLLSLLTLTSYFILSSFTDKSAEQQTASGAVLPW